MKLSERLSQKVYDILYRSGKPEVYMTVKDNTITFQTQSSKTFKSDDKSRIYKLDTEYRRPPGMGLLPIGYREPSLKSILNVEFLNRVYKGERGCYVSPYISSGVNVTRVDEGVEYLKPSELGEYGLFHQDTRIEVSNFHYVISFPFIPTTCGTYFDILPVEISYVIMTKNYPSPNILINMFDNVITSYVFNWKKFFAQIYPELYSQLATYGFDLKLSELPDGWRKMYTYIQSWSHSDMVRLQKIDSSEVIPSRIGYTTKGESESRGFSLSNINRTYDTEVVF